MRQETVLQLLAKMGPVVLSILGSVPHQCQEKPQLLRHCLLKMNRQVRRTQFPKRILEECWVHPITRCGKDTLKDASAKYINYIKGKGGPLLQRGIPFPQVIGQMNPVNKRTKNEQILR